MAEKGRKKKNIDRHTPESTGPRLACLEIDQIRLYDRNPRTVRNPEYERIKQSIANHGLEQPLIVTQRPGEQGYMVKAGGNTRLQILKELHAASGDPCYAMVNCIEVGWNDESSVLLGHLRENNLRGDLTFGDKAAAVCAFAEMLSEERDGLQPSIRELQSALNEQGYPVSNGSLSYMRYAADFLLSAIPVALSDGLGRFAVEKIRRLHSVGSQIWVARDIGPADEFDDVFVELCRRSDGPDWQIEPLQYAMETEIAEAADISVQTIRMAIDAHQFAGAAIQIPNQIESWNAQPGEDDADNSSSDAPEVATKGQQRTTGEPETLTLEIDLHDDSKVKSANPPQTRLVPRTCPFLDLRRRAYGLAEGLASRFGLADLITPLPDCGNGFLVADVPGQALLDSIDNGSRAATGTMWWQLLAFSETANAPASILNERLPPSSQLREILRDKKIELLFDRVAIIEAAYLADQFWAKLPKEDWQDWQYLAHTHREIRAKVIETERALWSLSQ